MRCGDLRAVTVEVDAMQRVQEAPDTGPKERYGMGMVMVIAVGDAEVPEDFLGGRMSRRTKERFEEQLSNL